ncbi:MAG: DUF192 domain-containing protein [Actinomycetota bacterium]
MARLRIDRLGRAAGALVVSSAMAGLRDPADPADAPGAVVASPAAVAAARAYVADRATARLVGMLGTPDPRPDEALVLVPCAAVHGVGLRARIGVVFVDRRGCVLRVVDPLPRRGASCRGAHAVIEAASGVLDLAPGDRVWLAGAALFPHGG